MGKTTKILIARHQLRGGKKAGDREIVEAQHELSAERQKALGLTSDDVEALIARGAVVEVDAKAAESSGDAEVRAATKRADAAEAKVATLEQEKADLAAEVAELKTKVETLQKQAAAPKA